MTLNKWIVLIVNCFLLTFACSCPKETIQPNTNTAVHYVDSTRWHDSTIFHIIPVERYRDYTSLLDTLHMETSMATAEAWVDTTANTLKGSIENKNDSIKTVIKWKERIIYKDSIQTKEIPVEIEVPIEIVKYPKTYWVFMAISILTLIFVALKIYLKIKL